MFFYEISVVTNTKINECFGDMFQAIYNMKRKVDEESTVKIVSIKKNNEQCC